MKSQIHFCIVFLVLLSQTGCASQPAPSPTASGHVTYDLNATLNSKPLPPLQAITAESCYDGYGGYSLAFTAIADMDPQSIDDEISLSLDIRIDPNSEMIVGKPIDVANSAYIHLSANAIVFTDAPQDPVTTATGTLTLTALSQTEMSGSASLMFSDPGDVNPVVKDSLAYEVVFTNLAIVHYCPES
jgi:hypothetical protein